MMKILYLFCSTLILGVCSGSTQAINSPNHSEAADSLSRQYATIINDFSNKDESSFVAESQQCLFVPSHNSAFKPYAKHGVTQRRLTKTVSDPSAAPTVSQVASKQQATAVTEIATDITKLVSVPTFVPSGVPRYKKKQRCCVVLWCCCCYCCCYDSPLKT